MARTSRYGARAAANLLDAGARLGDRHHADRGHRGRQRKGCRASARANSWIRSCSRRRRERIQQFSCRALATAARRPRTPSRSQALRRWKLTVLSLRPRMREVSQLVLPMAAQRRHWACRGDSGRAAGREPGAARAGAAGVSAGASAGRSAEPGRDCGMASGAGGRWRVDDADHVRPSSQKAANLRACTYCPLIFDGIVACRPSSSSISRPSC